MGMLATCNLQGLELHQCKYHPDQPVSRLLLGFAGCSRYRFLYSIDLGALRTLIQEIFTLTISGYWRILMILEIYLIWRFEWDEMMKKWKLGMICTWWKVSALTACWRNFCVWLFKWCKAGRCRRHHRRSRKCGRTRPMPAACGRSGIEIHDACIFPRGRLQWKNGIKNQEIGRSC